MKNPEIIAVTLSNNDVALFVNGDAVLTLDFSDSGENPTEIGKSLAKALGVELQEVEMDVPTDEDWSWNDVYELLPPPKLDKQPENDEIPVGETGSLVTLDGEEIIGTYEKVWGVAGVIGAVRNPDGSFDFEYDGDTDIDWNSQETEKEDGEMLFVTASNLQVKQSQVKLVKAD